MTSKMYDHKMKMENMLNKAKALEEEKLQATNDYDLKNKRGLTSQTENKVKPPKPNLKSKAQMAAEAEQRMMNGGTPQKDDNTFLTDLMMGKKR